MSISLHTKLAILQQCEYEWPRYLQWLSNNKDSEIVVKPKEWTLKLKLLKILTPFLTLQGALWILHIPQTWIIWSWTLAATVKLRYLQSKGLIVIAIAGSYGKTSTKYIAAHILSSAKIVAMTPENINTPIGIARFILTGLDSNHEVFIAELGEYYRGDIAGLVGFLSPNIKVLTPVGFAHLQRFGSHAALEQGLRELLTTQPKRAKSYVYGTDYDETKLDAVSVSRAGTEFSIDGRSYFLPLFGKHNAVNSLPGLWLAAQLGIDPNKAQAALATMEYIPHRLEPRQLENNILLLDNGYNSNPASAREALSVLKALEASQKIVCTPGFVELGEQQDAENELLGKEIAAVADICVVIASVNATSIKQGLLGAGFDSEQIIDANDEIKGMELIAPLAKPSAIVLFENSVPELYKSYAKS